MATWQKPRIIHLNSIAESLGNCVDGTTATASTCEFGDDTGLPHSCLDGGFAAADSCSAGYNVSPTNYPCIFGQLFLWH
ncbi:MAG: hypothetical protein FJ026_01130 [Chloroflexi bacterium]|nr:hypothetical protein [Chloroflexota bacterium]